MRTAERTARRRAWRAWARAACTSAALWAGGRAAAQMELMWIDQSGRLTAPEPAAAAGGSPPAGHPGASSVALVCRGPAAGAMTWWAGSGASGAQQGSSEFAGQFVSSGLGAEGDTPTDVTFTRDGAWIVIAHRDSRNLTVLDAVTHEVLQSIALSGSPNAVAVSADGVHAVTANIFQDTASIANLLSGQETAVIPVGDQPGAVRVSPGGATAVVGNTVSADLSVIDIAAGVETDRIAGVQFASLTSINFETGVVVSRFTQFEFAGSTLLLHPERFNSRVQFVDIAAGTVTPLATAANPDALDVSPDGTTAVVTHGGTTRLVSVIDVPAHAVSDTIATGVDLSTGAIAINAARTKAVVGVLNEVRVVNLASGTVSPNIPTTGVNGLLTTADGLYCLVMSFNGSLVSFASESVVANLNGLVSTNLGAVSPAAPRAAMAGSLFTEELLVVNTDGAAGFLEARLPTGPPPEGDRARHVAFTPDGAQALAVNILSDSLSLLDPAASQVTAILPTGDRPSEVAITPDGATAAVANLDSTFLTVVDVAARTAAPVTISTRASQVETSPDGQLAYVAVVAQGDGVWRVDLPGLAVLGPKVLTGDMGSVGFLYQQTSGMTLSHDGATLVTCNSFTDNISIIDTAAWAEVVRLPVGDFPVRAAFAPDDSRIFVSNRDGDTVSVVENQGGSSFVSDTIPVGDQPFALACAPHASRLFVGNFTGQSISVVDVPGGFVEQTIGLGQPVQDLVLDEPGERLYATGGNWSVTIGPGPAISMAQSGRFAVIDAVGLGVEQLLDTGIPPAAMALHEAGPDLAVASPHGDGVLLLAEPSCPADTNGDGQVDVQDLVNVIVAWGSADPDADVDGSGTVDVNDLVALIVAWGPC